MQIHVPPEVIDDSIRFQLRKLHKEEIAALQVFEDAKRAISCRRRGVQDACEHRNVMRFSDPAGGFGSFKECQVCGKEM